MTTNTLKPFPTEKISEETLNFLAKSIRLTNFVEGLMWMQFELPDIVEKNLVGIANGGHSNLELSSDLYEILVNTSCDNYLGYIVDRAMINNYPFSDYVLSGIISAKTVKMITKYQLIKLVLDTGQNIPFTVDRLLDAHIYDFMFYIIDNWVTHVAEKYWEDPRVSRYIDTLDSYLKQDLVDAMKRNKLIGPKFDDYLPWRPRT